MSTLLLGLLLTAPGLQTLEVNARPNVLVILADDLGLGDVTPTNADCLIATPNVARLAAEGLTFTDAHSPSAVCTPSRYGLLTGRYAWRTRLASGVLWGDSGPLVPADRPTVARMLDGVGYRTEMLGKWHLGWEWGRDGGAIDFAEPVTHGPDAVGFDGYFALAASLDMPPYVWVHDGRVTSVPEREEGVTPAQDPYGWYRRGPIGEDFVVARALPDLFGRAVDFVRAQGESEEPFFLYLALPAPHTPILPLPPFRRASELNPYADFVMQIDHHVGELLAALDETEQAEDTLVVFTSDNGCSPEANFELLRAFGHDPSASFRGHKADLYEGGHRVPLVVRWPRRIAPGSRTDALASLTDLYPTLAQIVGEEPTDVGGEDGYSWVPLWEGAAANGRETLVHHSINGRFAFRRGPWKLLLAPGSGGWSAPVDALAEAEGAPPLQLYHLGRDPGERTNLVAEEPERVAELLRAVAEEIARGRSTPGPALANDREVGFLPEGVTVPVASER